MCDISADIATMEINDSCYTVAEVAEKMKVSERYVRMMITQEPPTIPGAFRLGGVGHWRLNARIFDEWLSKQGAINERPEGAA